MTVLGSLEDLLYEPISIGGGDSSDSSDDDAWNSCESKEGHSLRDEIATFADRAMAADDDAGDGEYPSRVDGAPSGLQDSGRGSRPGRPWSGSATRRRASSASSKRSRSARAGPGRATAAARSSRCCARSTTSRRGRVSYAERPPRGGSGRARAFTL